MYRCFKYWGPLFLCFFFLLIISSRKIDLYIPYRITESRKMICGTSNFKLNYKQLRTFLFVCFFVSIMYKEETYLRKNIPQNVWQQSPKCLAIFPGMFVDVSRDITFPSFSAFPALHSPLLYYPLYPGVSWIED